MKNQALFSSKDKSKKLKCRLLQFLFGALRVNKALPQKCSFRYQSEVPFELWPEYRLCLPV